MMTTTTTKPWNSSIHRICVANDVFLYVYQTCQQFKCIISIFRCSSQMHCAQSRTMISYSHTVQWNDEKVFPDLEPNTNFIFLSTGTGTSTIEQIEFDRPFAAAGGATIGYNTKFIYIFTFHICCCMNIGFPQSIAYF